MTNWINLNSFINSILYSSVGFIMLWIGFFVFDKLTPFQLWKEIVDEQNIALAVVVGAMALGISNIIAAGIAP